MAQATYPQSPSGTELSKGEKFRTRIEYVNALGQ